MRALVVTDVHRLIEIYRGVVHAGAGSAANTQLVERGPVLDGHDSVDQGNLHSILQRFFLCCWQFLAQVGDHHVPAGEHGALATHGISLAFASVGDFYFLSGHSVAYVPYSYGRAAETHTNGR